MLEVRGLTKVYKPKRGVPVKAVDHVDLKFPEKGMIFLLGKSGSGKSTMLNLLGGLDVYDEGEIIIKDKSSKDFKQRDFDSYRNTYLGFIFQEYNILNDFNVGANIALALQLQGLKASDEKINEILKQVDLEGFGLRKPNELSGGQKQRVAIARALVKDPEIIMADEPTGALDSETGRQVLDTLKKLSAEKLVIVVSHDRDFAEKYADRIIELADGKVIDDREFIEAAADYDAEAAEEVVESSSGIIFEENTVKVAPAYHLTEEDRIAINEWIDAHADGVSIEVGQTAEAKKSYGRRSVPTDESRISSININPFHLIKSKLPMKHAFKMGASGLKHKKVRLVITIILSFVAYTLFGLADTMGSYDYVSAGTQSIQDSKISYAAFQKTEQIGIGIISYDNNVDMEEADLEKIRKNTGIEVEGVVNLLGVDKSFNSQYNKLLTDVDMFDTYADSFSGYVTVSEKTAKAAGLELIAGRFADGSRNEMVISDYVAYTFMTYGYRSPDSAEESYAQIKTEADMVGRIIRIGGVDMEVVGVVDTGFDFGRYNLKLSTDAADVVLNYILSEELRNYKESSFICMMMVGEGYITNQLNSAGGIYIGDIGSMDLIEYSGPEKEWKGCLSANKLKKLSEIDSSDIVWLGDAKTTLTGDEFIVDETCLVNYLKGSDTKFDSVTNISEGLYEYISNLKLTKDCYLWNNDGVTEDAMEKEATAHIVGFIPKGKLLEGTFIVDDDTYEMFDVGRTGEYSFALGVMPEKQADIRQAVAFSHKDARIKYKLQNSVMYELELLDTILHYMGRAFWGIGIFFAIFASILMATFISSSISYKRKEIGILRAIGARGSDVFRVFFSESFIIAMINFVLASIGTVLLSNALNSLLRNETGILVTILHFGIRQVILLFIISIAVAAVASFLPVFINAKKKPIDVIRDK